MNHETKRENWIQAIHKVNDDLDSIFYYLSINPALCNNCFDDEQEAAAMQDAYSLMCSGLLYQNLSMPAMPTTKRRRPASEAGLVASSYMQSAKRMCTASPPVVPTQPPSPVSLPQPPSNVAVAQPPPNVLHQAQHVGLPNGFAAAAAALPHLGGLNPQMALALPLQFQHAALPGSPLHHAAAAAQLAHVQLAQAQAQVRQQQQQQHQDPPGSFYQRLSQMQQRHGAPNFPF